MREVPSDLSGRLLGLSAELTPEGERNLAALRRALQRSPGFAVYVVIAVGEARTEVLRRLAGWAKETPGARWKVLARGAAGVRALREFLASEETCDGLVVADGEALVREEEGAAAVALNLARDRLWQKVAGPLVLCVSAEREVDLQRIAPDLYDVRAGSYVVEAQHVLGPTDMALLVAPRGGRPPSLKKLRAKASQLSFLEHTTPPGALADAWLEVAEGFWLANERGEAQAAAEQVLRLAERAGYQAGMVRAWGVLGEIAAKRGEYAVAERLLRQALAMARRLGELRLTGNALESLGFVVAIRGRTKNAAELLEQAIRAHSVAGSLEGLVQGISQLGEVLIHQGRLEEAEQRLRGALDLARQIHAPAIEGATWGRLGELYLRLNDLDQARICLERALELDRQTGGYGGRALGLLGLARVSLGQGRTEEAEHLLLEGTEMLRQGGGRLTLAQALALLGELYRRSGALERAEHALGESLDLYRQMGLHQYTQRVETLLAAIAQEKARAEAPAAEHEAAQGEDAAPSDETTPPTE